MTESRVEVRRTPEEVGVRVVGRATASVGPELRAVLAAASADGVRSIVFDLGQCTYMDSTFIGILSMAAVDARDTPTRVSIAQAGPRPRQHLASLGVDGLFTYVDAALSAEGSWETLAAPAAGGTAGQLQALGRTALAAHEALGRANPGNVPRFKDVIAALRQETESREDPQ